MAIITPDISAFYPGYGQPQEPNQPTDPSQIAQLVKQMSGTGGEAMLAELVRQGMTKGLGVGDGSIGQLDGRLNYSGPVAGYAGPLRESDKPSGPSLPTMKPDDAFAMDRQQEVRNLGGGQIGQVMDLLGGLPKGLDDSVQTGVLNRAFPGIIPPGLDKGSLRAAERQQAALDKTDLSQWFNRKTGEPAGLDQIGSFDQLKQDYMRLNTQQKNDVNILPQLQALVTEYKRLEKELPLADEGFAAPVKSWFSMKNERLQGRSSATDLDSINARIASLAQAFGGDKRVSDKEMALLKGAVITETDSTKQVRTKLNNLEKFMNTRVNSSGLPWLRNQPQSEPEQPTPKPSASQTAPDADGWITGPGGIRYRVK